MRNKTKQIECTGTYSIRDKGVDSKRYNLIKAIQGGGREVFHLTENRDISVIPDSAGGANVGVKVSELFTPNYGIHLFDHLGAQFVNFKDNAQISRYDGSKAYWLSEKDETPEGSGGFTKVFLPPFRIGVYLKVSDMFLNQSENDVADTLVRDMGNSIWNLFAGTYFSDQAGTGKSIEGIFHNNVNTVSNYDDFLAVEKELLERGTIPNFYLTNPAGYVKLKGLLKTDNVVGESVQRPIDGFVTASTVSGIPLVVSYNVGGTGSQTPYYALGNFRDLFVAEYEQIQFTIDGMTGAREGVTHINAQAYLNAGWGRNSFTTALLV